MGFPMQRLSRHLIWVSLLLAADLQAGPADAARIRKEWDLRMETWTLETKIATTPEARAKALANRPDAAKYAREMWQAIGSSLDQEWTLEPAAWFLRATPGLLKSNPDGGTSPIFALECETIRRTVEAKHLNSPKLIPMCMALVAGNDPRSLAMLEKVQASHPDPKVQGVAALAAAMVLKTLGDDPPIMRQRLTYLKKAIIQSSDVDLGGATVAKLAEDELYIIRFLTKGREAPDLSGYDSGGRPLKLSDFKGKVVMLVFWSSNDIDAERLVHITRETEAKLQGKPFVVIGVNQDTQEKLRALEADSTVTWRNFSDPNKQLANEYRVGTWPLVYVLDGGRKIHYAGAPGSFAEATAQALLAAPKPAAK